MALRLVGGVAFLALHRGPDLRSHFVSLYSRFEDALFQWGPGSRISPIFPVADGPLPSLSGNQRAWFTFFGPLFPGRVAPDRHPAIFLSLGLFNVILFSRTDEEKTLGRELATQLGLRWEEWCLDGERLIHVEFSSPSQSGVPTPRASAPPRELPDALIPALREYSTLIAASLGRAASALPDFAEDIQRFDGVFRQMLANREAHITSKLGQLIKANAALSRFTSQTFTGTSPILETESHFWTHSLLGVGIASLALWRIRQFVEGAYAASRLDERLSALRNIDPVATSLTALPSTDAFWEIDHLFDYAEHSDIPEDKPIIGDRLPLVTYFIGRDGFRSTNVSLSAPLEVISSCNATSWTPLTITHEISHQIIEDVLGTVLPNPDDHEEVRKIVAVLNGKIAPNLFRQIEAFLCFAVWRMEDADDDAQVELDEMCDLIHRHAHDLREILTHVLDFLYFYRRDDRHYVASLWITWGMVRDIGNRVSDYLIRTLCALHTANLRRKSGPETTIDQLATLLKDIQQEYDEDLYIPQARHELDENKKFYIKTLRNREPIVKFVRYILFSPKIERLFTREPSVGGGPRGGYVLRSLEFEPEHRIANHSGSSWNGAMTKHLIRRARCGYYTSLRSVAKDELSLQSKCHREPL